MSDRWDCGCGHKHVSHGSFNSMGQYLGMGAGQCGIEGCTCMGYEALAPFIDGEPVTFLDAVRGPVDAVVMPPLPARPGEQFRVHVGGDGPEEFYLARQDELTTQLVNHFGGTPMYDESACSTCGGTKALHYGPDLGAALLMDCSGYTS
jgi:hypothetical protein